MRLLCWLFGHQPPSESRFTGGSYGKMGEPYRDGVGRQHVILRGDCPRCEQEYVVMNSHLPMSVVKQMKDYQDER